MVVSAAVKGGPPNIVLGVNDHEFDLADEVDDLKDAKLASGKHIVVKQDVKDRSLFWW